MTWSDDYQKIITYYDDDKTIIKTTSETWEELYTEMKVVKEFASDGRLIKRHYYENDKLLYTTEYTLNTCDEIEKLKTFFIDLIGYNVAEAIEENLFDLVANMLESAKKLNLGIKEITVSDFDMKEGTIVTNINTQSRKDLLKIEKIYFVGGKDIAQKKYYLFDVLVKKVFYAD